MGWFLACLHAAWFFLAIANMSPPSPGLGEFLDNGGGSSATLLAGRPFHFHYESLLLKLIILVDLPSLLAMIPFSLLVLPLSKLFHLSFYHCSYSSAALLLFGASCQWLLVGNRLRQRLESARWGKWVNQQLRQGFVIIIMVILVATLILTPFINERSRSLGFRHGGISFR
jgi:hypothetical protein